uniref:Uncharacterized protein n=1 Tax=Physcomitrium patens TaxID=3218 RepID=A0A7I4BG98_PHYPA
MAGLNHEVFGMHTIAPASIDSFVTVTSCSILLKISSMFLTKVVGNIFLFCRQTIESILSRHFPKTGLWFQDPDLYHFSMHHASHHQNPVPATLEEINSEAAAVRQVAEKSLILEIELERVVLTPSGVLVGCWQVSKGTDPAVIREELRNALPRSPAKQLYNPVIFYTSFARILSAPLTARKDYSADAVLEILKGLVSQLNQNLCSKAAVKELWYVEELDLLALALKGRTRIRRFQLQSDPKG